MKNATTKIHKAKAASWVLAITMLTIIALSILGLFSNVNTTVEYDEEWKGAYLAVLIVLFVMLAIAWSDGKAELDIEGGIFKKIFVVIAGLFGVSLLAAFAVFSGVPTALHYLGSEKGQIEVTVIEKDDVYNVRKCNPRLIIKEFTFFNSEYICPGKEVFEKISEGSKITLIGDVSPYGIELTEIQWLTRK